MNQLLYDSLCGVILQLVIFGIDPVENSKRRTINWYWLAVRREVKGRYNMKLKK